jgi:hypothetical protein
MEADAVRLSWGYPKDINRTVTAFGTHEQWIYEKEFGKRVYLYFDNGVLESWQDSR